MLARGHSNDLAIRRPQHIDHLGLRNCFERASESIALISFAENVARMGRKRPGPATCAVESWAASESHRRKLEGNFDLMGVDFFRREDWDYFFTQIFGATPEVSSASAEFRILGRSGDDCWRRSFAVGSLGRRSLIR